MASKMVDEMFGKHLKLTKNKILIKTGDKSFTIMCFSDHKRVTISLADINQLRVNLVEKDSQESRDESMPDAVLDKYVVKYSAGQDYYAIVHKANYGFIMGLKMDTIAKIINLHNYL